MKLSQSVSICLRNYFNFSGRASLWEFWWFYIVVSFSILIARAVSPAFAIAIKIATLIPMHAAAVRRMNDQGRRDWPILALSPLLIFLQVFALSIFEIGANRVDILFSIFAFVIWALALSCAYWILIGPSFSHDQHGSPNEVTP